MMLGAQAGPAGSSVSASNSNSRSGSGGDNAGSSSSAGSNDGWMPLAHPSAYVSLMRAFLASGREDGLDAALRLRDEMVERSMPLGRAGYTVVADAYATRGDFNKVEDTLREMLAREPTLSGPALSPVHQSIRMKCLCNAGRVDDALALLPECANADAAVYNTLLFAVARLNDRDRMITVLRAMESAGVEPDDITTRALQPLMRQLARVLRTFDARFHSRITQFVTSRADGGEDGSPGTGETVPADDR
jgi:pentatricopeptide repeat protein